MNRRSPRINLLFVFNFACVVIVMARHAHHLRSQETDCHSCPPGQGVVHRCRGHRQTECRPCHPGYYSSHHSSHRPCYPCSRCGLGLYVAHVCTSTKDTVCDSCHTYKGPHNEDFTRKCITPLTNETASADSLGTEYQSGHNKEALKSPRKSQSFPVFVSVIAAFSTCVFLVSVSITCLICIRNRHHKKTNCKYTYHPVSTQEIVML